MKKFLAKIAQKYVTLLPSNGLKLFAWILWGFLKFHIFYLWLQVRCCSGVTFHFIDIFVTRIGINILRYFEGPSCCQLPVMSLWMFSYYSPLTQTTRLTPLKSCEPQVYVEVYHPWTHIGNTFRFFDLWYRVTWHKTFIVSTLQGHAKTHQLY